jgi:predicted transcriptional regulator
MTEYDVSKLDKLGARRAKLRADLEEVTNAIAAEVPAAHDAGVIQAEIARRLGMTRESIKQLTLPREQRWQRGKGQA